MSMAVRTEGEHEVPAEVVPGGAVTWISAEDLAAMTGTGGSTIGQPAPVNGHPVGEEDCPYCSGEAG